MKKIYKIRRFFRSFLKKKIRIVFVCHRPEVWESQKSIFNACVKDKNFDVFLVTIPNKAQLPDLGLNHNVYRSEGVEEYFKDYPCTVINGYDYTNGSWFDLKKIKPDYVFFQQPYNICRPKKYWSKTVSKYADVCYISYGVTIFKGEVETSVHPTDFLKDCKLGFANFKFHQKTLEKICSGLERKPVFYSPGYTRFDNIKEYIEKGSDLWSFDKSKNITRIIWTPRWCTNENTCTFFDYKDALLQYAEDHKDIDFIFRPHPQALSAWVAEGNMSKEEENDYIGRYEKSENANIDRSKEYLSTFYSSDILISDISSVMVDYFMTGKPIIYTHKTDLFNDFGKKLAEGFYWVRNWDELKKTIEMLKSGNDPLKEKRQEIIKSEFYIPETGAGETIKDIIKGDFYGKR